jgi:photosystem II stability/assembly factor-like uncharacterized protein
MTAGNSPAGSFASLRMTGKRMTVGAQAACAQGGHLKAKSAASPGPCSRPTWRTLLTTALLAVLTPTFPLTLSAESSERAPLAAHSLLLGIARAGDRLVAVGDRGHVLLSDDAGANWRQVLVPTRAMLTAVSFPDDRHGWAVGHDGVILATVDAGETWKQQDPGTDLETSYLDVLFISPQHGFAVGAYGKFVTTTDGGTTWKPGKPSEGELHYNRIAAGPNGFLYLAGESGILLGSHNGGATWIRSELPYDGSFFCVVPVDAGTVIVAGLRGHVFTSNDNGGNWTQCPVELKTLIMGGIVLRSGMIVLAGQNGHFLLSRDHGTTFTVWKPAETTGAIADLSEANNGNVVAVGENGATRLTLP